MADFFISYTSADKSWAEWIGYVLEEEGLQVTIQAWDFRPGNNFVVEMQKASSEADRTIMVLSPDYLKSRFTLPEWAAAFTVDPQGLQGKLVPIVVRQCQTPGLLAGIVHIDLTSEDESGARKRLLDGVRIGRAKPAKRPAFPISNTGRPHKSFPGSASPGPADAQVPRLRRPPTDADRRNFSKLSFDVIRSYVQNGLNQITHRNDVVEYDFQEASPSDFSAEVFVSGKSTCQCRIWLGNMISSECISYSEGQRHHGSNACNEILSVKNDQDHLYLSSMMGTGYIELDISFDLKKMNPEQAAEYLWRRLVSPLER